MPKNHGLHGALSPLVKINVAIECLHFGSRKRGAHLLFLPPYSLDLNPIELAFAKLKALLRKAGERSVDDLWARIGECLDAFTPEECRNYFKHAGYA